MPDSSFSFRNYLRRWHQGTMISPRSRSGLLSWSEKQLDLATAIRKIHSGSHIFIGNGAAAPQKLIEAMSSPECELVDNEIIVFLNTGLGPYLAAGSKRFRINAFYIDEQLGPWISEGCGDYTPLSVSSIARLVQTGQIKVDVALIKVSPPNRDGYCSLGIGVDMTREMVEKAKLVIAEVTSEMPVTCGNSLLRLDEIDYWVSDASPLVSAEPAPYDDTLNQIGKHLASQIENGATLRIGLGEAANSVLAHLGQHQHLGLHTEVLTEGLMRLIQQGVIDNSRKRFHKGQSIVSHAVGSSELYRFVHENPQVQFHPLAYTNHWQNIARNQKMTTIAEAIEIDLTGQVCAESRGRAFYKGFGGTADFLRGSALSKGGKTLIALRSTAHEHLESAIVPELRPGAGVVVTRAEVSYIVTEYGTAYLHGKTIRERSLALIEISHPKFRDILLHEAKHRRYISPQQPGYSFKTPYPQELEREFHVRNGKLVKVRPVKAIDEGKMRDFFHALSDRSVYLRYFRHVRSLPSQVLQGVVDIDYSRNMSLLVLHTPPEGQEEIIALGQWVMDDTDGLPELAFQVRDDWQGQGLGKYLMLRLVEIAQTRQIPKLKAEVLLENTSMLKVFETAGYPLERRNEFGVTTLKLDITPPDISSLVENLAEKE